MLLTLLTTIGSTISSFSPERFLSMMIPPILNSFTFSYFPIKYKYSQSVWCTYINTLRLNPFKISYFCFELFIKFKSWNCWFIKMYFLWIQTAKDLDFSVFKLKSTSSSQIIDFICKHKHHAMTGLRNKHHHCIQSKLWKIREILY